MLKAALAYARRGVPVFPCEPGAKRPLTRNGHWDATKDPHAIGRWWKRWPFANVAVPTGKKSGVVVLDVDPATGGPESLARLERLGGPVPKTARARTGGGGGSRLLPLPEGDRDPQQRGIARSGARREGRGRLRRGTAQPHAGPLRVGRQVASRGGIVADRAPGRGRGGDAVLRGVRSPPGPGLHDDTTIARNLSPSVVPTCVGPPEGGCDS
jgi:hypothetical protein